MGRGYQESFYTHSERVHDPVSRQKKADKIIQALIRHTRCPLSSAICLDIGCSSGMVTSAIASSFGKIVGLEYDEVALRATGPAARAMVRFIRGDAMCLPLGDNSVNAIICAQVYEHVPDDGQLFREIYRVLTPGGLVFLSGPNWLFPIEPHYFLPLLHWLPGRLADAYLRLTGQGDHYYEQSRHLWGLRRLLCRFVIHDITLEVLHDSYLRETRGLKWIVRGTPTAVWRLLLPFFPNFNWILYKPAG